MGAPYDSDRLLSYLPFGPDAYINRRLASNPPLDPQSSTKAAAIVANRNTAFFGTGNGWCALILDDTASSITNATVDRRGGSTQTPDGQVWRIPTGAGSTPDTGGTFGSGSYSTSDDNHLGLINYSGAQAGRMLSCRMFYGLSGTTMQVYSAGTCAINQEGRLSSGTDSPSTGSGLHIMYGTLLPEDFILWQETKTVRHGLRIVPNQANVQPGTVYPATKNDGNSSAVASQAVKEAQILRLDMTDSEIAAISGPNATIASLGRMVATMARDFGFYVFDKTTGSAWSPSVRPETYTQFGVTNPIQTLTGYSTFGQAFRLVTGILWNKLVVVQEGYAPLVASGPTPNQPPVPNFTFTPSAPLTGQTVTFTDTSTDPDGGIASRAWDLDNDGAFDDGTGATASTSFGSTGAKTVRLQVTDDDGASAIVSKQVTVSSSAPANTPPVASFSQSPTNPQTGQTITFTDTSTDVDGTIASRAWDTDNDGSFDDGTGSSVTKSFGAAGTYTVRLQVTDDDGATAIATRSVTVVDPPPTTTIPTAPVSFTATVSEPNVALAFRLDRNDNRTRARIMRRTASPSSASPTAAPTPTTVYDSTGGAASGNTLVGATMKALRPGVDEVKLVKITTGTVQSISQEIYVWVDGAGGGTGAATLKAIAFVDTGGSPDGGARAFLGAEVTITAGDPGKWVATGVLGSDALGLNRDFWVGFIVGGDSNVARIARSADTVGERYIDSGITYASPPSTCPTTTTASNRSSIYLLLEPGGGPLGGLINVSDTPPVGDAYYRGYAEGQAGSSYLDSTPNPASVGAATPSTTGDFQLTFTGSANVALTTPWEVRSTPGIGTGSHVQTRGDGTARVRIAGGVAGGYAIEYAEDLLIDYPAGSETRFGLVHFTAFPATRQMIRVLFTSAKDGDTTPGALLGFLTLVLNDPPDDSTLYTSANISGAQTDSTPVSVGARQDGDYVMYLGMDRTRIYGALKRPNGTVVKVSSGGSLHGLTNFPFTSCRMVTSFFAYTNSQADAILKRAELLARSPGAVSSVSATARKSGGNWSGSDGLAAYTAVRYNGTPTPDDPGHPFEYVAYANNGEQARGALPLDGPRLQPGVTWSVGLAANNEIPL